MGPFYVFNCHPKSPSLGTEKKTMKVININFLCQLVVFNLALIKDYKLQLKVHQKQ